MRVDEGCATAHPHLVCLVRRYSRGVLSPGRHVRTRLYFTSESHVHSLLSIFRYGSLLDVSPLKIRAAAFQTPSIRRDTVNGRLSVSLCVCVCAFCAAGGEGPAVEARHGLPQRRL